MSIQALAQHIKASRKTVFFGGAGTSTASGIPDFRSADGLYATEFEGLNPETILSASFFYAAPDRFYRYLSGHMYYPEALPNGCHKSLAEMEAMGYLHSVITQNIDGLHQAAGSRRVIELHGNMNRYSCLTCSKHYEGGVLEALLKDKAQTVARCTCGGLLKPEVTLYEEMLDESSVEGAIEAISTAEVLIIGGTSLSVYPAAGFIRYFRGEDLVIMNQRETQADLKAKWLFREPIDQVMTSLVEALK